MNDIKNVNVFTRDEDEYLRQALEYIASTYGAHYVQDKNKIQLIDYWESRGTLLTTSIDTSIKYLARYGRKEGYNKKDIFKAIHYAILALYATRHMQEEVDHTINDKTQ